ncbi:MAG: pyruvate, phosphate dikinase, partial [Deltaproteobacteria bacterium]|nr:pyruvate, phosphate dikinase [Deltaproteobacteria bacterium]
MAKRATRKRSVQKRTAQKRTAQKKGARKQAKKAAPGRRSVYFFGDGRAQGRASMRDLLGGKGANLAEMTRLGVPVPAGFTISTEVCADFYSRGRKLGREVRGEILDALARVEKVMETRFGSSERPLLVSIRSGARVSMPGMMDTVLNLGLNDETVEGLAKESGDRRFAFDSYRRFVQMYGDVVLNVEHESFKALLEAKKQERGVEQDTALDVDDLTALVREYKRLVQAETGSAFPDDPAEQLWGAIAAVFDSWNTPRAVHYRKLNGIADDWGTAVNVQAMVFGNLGDDSATGVAFTRDPSTGERRFFGEFLPKAQGEDVVAGIRTPQKITRKSRRPGGPESLEELMPGPYRELRRTAQGLEKHYRDMQDLEFTIQRGRLWMLQTRTGTRTGRAAVRIAVEMVRERLIDRDTALKRVDPEQLNQLLHPMLDPSSTPPPIGEGLAASPGAASGSVVFSADVAEAKAADGEEVILVRRETSPEDIHGMSAAQGILTELGGTTSHAAVVARGMGKCCVCGCSDLQFAPDGASVSIGGVEFREGDTLTIDGSTGYVFKGSVPTVEAEPGKEFKTLMGWADRVRRL